MYDQGIKLGIIFTATLSLTSCGGGGGGNDGGSSRSVPDEPTSSAREDLDYDEIVLRGEKVIQEVEALDITPIEAMPTRGSATYDGYAAFYYGTSDGETPNVVSQLTMDADFASSSVGGQFYDLSELNAGELDGTLDISNGEISGNEFSGDVSGRVSDSAGREADVSMGMQGGFGGDDASRIVGETRGTSTTSAGTIGVFGAFGGRER